MTIDGIGYGVKELTGYGVKACQNNMNGEWPLRCKD